jgi:H+/Cl- antiporter ClcA
VAAAFNTPLAGVAFAIEELASAFEQRLALLVMLAVMTSGLVSLALSGDYVYFGAMSEHVPIVPALVAALVTGVAGAGAVRPRAQPFRRNRHRLDRRDARARSCWLAGSG